MSFDYELSEEYKRLLEKMRKDYMPVYNSNTSGMMNMPGPFTTATIRTPPSKSVTVPVYSLCTVQLVEGSTIALTITASPKLASHLIREMKDTGFLNLFNDTEALCIRADRVVAVSLQQMTREE